MADLDISELQSTAGEFSPAIFFRGDEFVPREGLGRVSSVPIHQSSAIVAGFDGFPGCITLV
jgi:hypothetical protein